MTLISAVVCAVICWRTILLPQILLMVSSPEKSVSKLTVSLSITGLGKILISNMVSDGNAIKLLPVGVSVRQAEDVNVCGFDQAEIV